MDLTGAVTQERRRSQSRMRPLSLLADRTVGEHHPNVAVSQAASPQHSKARVQRLASQAGDHGNASHVFEAHVGESLQSIQGQNKRHSAYMLDSLAQMQEGLAQATAEDASNTTRATSDNEQDRVNARAQALLRLTQEDDTSEDETEEMSPLTTPHESVQTTAPDLINEYEPDLVHAIDRLLQQLIQDQEDDARNRDAEDSSPLVTPHDSAQSSAESIVPLASKVQKPPQKESDFKITDELRASSSFDPSLEPAPLRVNDSRP